MRQVNGTPFLALGMATAIAVALPYYNKRRGMLLSGNALPLPETRTITRPPPIVSAVFGIGWGFSGICPSPAVDSVVNHRFQVMVYWNFLAYRK